MRYSKLLLKLLKFYPTAETFAINYEETLKPIYERDSKGRLHVAGGSGNDILELLCIKALASDIGQLDKISTFKLPQLVATRK